MGTDADRTVTFSSYYEPTIAARLEKDSVYKYPLYARPPDLIDVNLSLFDPVYQGARVVGRREGQTLVPYPTRADIDSRKILGDMGLEIAWAKDPLDILDLQIEGSGWLDLGNHDVRRVRYDGDNGRRYKSVGQSSDCDRANPGEEVHRQAYLRYLSHHPKERQELLNVNERYIFFRIDTSTASVYAYGNIDVPLTAVAFDRDRSQALPKRRSGLDRRLQSFKRFMLNQDEGGAIQGPARVDFFAGHGKTAKQFATHASGIKAIYTF